MIELVSDCSNVSEVLAENNNDLTKYFRNIDGATDPLALDLFQKSCAGYNVVTYLLGIGDRHLDNLLLRHSGHLFHIDFGYFLGRDPKPFPPAFKLNTEMVEAMGGPESTRYITFQTLMIEAFNALRRSSNLLINLFTLMLDAGISDIIMLGRNQALSFFSDRFQYVDRKI